MKTVLLSGRILFSAIFLSSIPTYFSPQAVMHAGAQGVPWPSVLVPIGGVLAIIGSLSILLGLKARFGAWLLALFLVPVTLFMHRFWDAADPAMMHIQMANFMKNVSLLGSALMISYFGSGAFSIDAAMAHRHAEETKIDYLHKPAV